MDKNLNSMLKEVDEVKPSECYYCKIDQCFQFIPQPDKHLKILAQNIRSINANFDKLIIMLTALKFECDFIVLSECWLNSNKLLPQLPNYNTFTTTLSYNQNDGIVIYHKNNISCVVEEPSFPEANCLVAKIENHTAIVGIYRPPCFRKTTTFLKSLEALLDTLKGFKNIIITGDINIDISLEGTSEPPCTHYLNLTAEYGLLPTHTFPTRDRACLDHALLKSKAKATSIVIQTTITDHYPVLLSIPKTTSSKVKPDYFLKTKIDYQEAALSLNESNLSPILTMTDPCAAADILVNTLRECIQKFSTTKTITRKHLVSRPWITPGLLRCIRHRDNMHLKLKKHPEDITLSQSYRRYRNFCNSLLKKLKNEFERSEILKAGNNAKQSWNAIKRIGNFSPNKCPPSDLLKTKPNAKAAVNYINNFFANVGKNLAESIVTRSSPTSSTNKTKISEQTSLRSFVLLDTDEGEVERTILSLKNDSASGWDGISSMFLKLVKSKIVRALTHIINLCFSSGTFPMPFKRAVILPIHKSGPRDDVNNFRPISILPALSKVIEKILNKRLMTYLEQEKLLADSQYGFRANMSTEQAVSGLTEYITNSLDRKKKCVAIFLDLAKAFDTVSTPLLLYKLEKLGIRGAPLVLFQNYLSNRTQQVKIGEAISDDESITYGVPQGSILGPTLFLVFINDLCRFCPENGKIFTFADDTALVFEGCTWEQVQDRAERGLRDVISWLQFNLLSLNCAKSKVVVFSIKKKNSPNKENFKIRAHTCHNYGKKSCKCMYLERVVSLKYLGVVIDENLSWVPHIASMTVRIRKLIWVFKNLRDTLPLSLLKTVYFAICQSVLGYCVSVWGGACKTHLIKLERAQRSVLKVMLSRPFRYPTESLYQEAQVLTVRQLFILHAVLLQHKVVKFRTDLPISRTTKANVCEIMRIYTTFARNQSCYLRAYLYNKLNTSLKIYSMNRYSCKTSLTKWLLSMNYNATESIFTILS